LAQDDGAELFREMCFEPGKLVGFFGPDCINNKPSNIPFWICSNIISKRKNDLLRALLENIQEPHVAEWILFQQTTYSITLFKYILENTAMVDYVRNYRDTLDSNHPHFLQINRMLVLQ